MYSIFAPLDPNEPLPRELLLESKRHRPVGRRELAGALWLPAILLVMTAGAWRHLSGGATLAALGVVLAGLGVFALSDKWKPHH
jgi:hypothetical protein